MSVEIIVRPPHVLRSDPLRHLEEGSRSTTELLAWRRPGTAVWAALAVLGVLGLAGAGAVIALIAGGPDPRVKWGYAAATLAFLLSGAQSAPVLSILIRMTKGYWGIPIRRAADLFALAGIITTPLYVVLLFQLPDFRGRHSIWFDWPATPLASDAVGLGAFALAGLGLLYVGAIPDLAAARGSRLSRFALGWAGTERQWFLLHRALVVLGAFYIAMLLWVNLVLVSDLAGSLIPGWHSNDGPVYLFFSGLEAGLAMVLLATTALRRLGGLERHIEIDIYEAMSKLLLAFALLYIWFQWSELIVWWYGRTNSEKDLQALLLYGTYVVPFGMAVGLNFLLPLALLMWVKLRRTVLIPSIVAALIVVGNFADRVRLFVAAWSLAGPQRDTFTLPATHLPGALDVLIIAGGPCAFLFLYLLALRFLPPIALWEHKLDLLMRIHVPYIRTDTKVLAKQD